MGKRSNAKAKAKKKIQESIAQHTDSRGRIRFRGWPVEDRGEKQTYSRIFREIRRTEE